MGKFRALLGVSFKAMLFSLRVGGNSRRRAFTGVGAMALMGGLALYLSGTYSFLFAAQLAPMGMLPLVVMMMPVLAVAAGLFFTLFAAQGIVFGGRDNDLMLSMPVSAFALLLSRVLALYLENLVFSLVVMLPAGAAYLWYGGEGGLRFALVLLLCVPFLALLPTMLALVGGFALSWLSGRFARRRAVSLLLYLILLVLALAGGVKIDLLLADMASAAAGIQASMSVWGLPFLWLRQAACGGDAAALLRFCALCLLPFLALVWLFAGQYKKIVTGLTSRGARSDYRLGHVAALGARRALLKKEAARFFGTPIYLFNTGIGLIFLLAGGVFALFTGRYVPAVLDQLALLSGGQPPAVLLAAAVCFLLSTVAVTASSISLEGRQLWILKESPVSAGTLFAVKAGFQLLLVLPVLVLSTACLALACGLTAGEWLLVLLPGAAFSVASALFGLYINLCFPRLDAPNDMVVVKQSAAAMLGIFLPMLALGLCVLFYLALDGLLGPAGAVLACTGLLALAALVLSRLLHSRGARLFYEL